MKTAYYLVTIPAGEFLTTADTTNGVKLSYFDYFDHAIIYRYFDTRDIQIKRIPAGEGARRLRQILKEGGRPESFESLQRFGAWR